MRLPVLPAVLLSTAAVGAAVVLYWTPLASPSPGAGPPPVHFRTLPPGARLPSGAQCARWVRESPSAENRAVNKAFNRGAGQHVGPGFFAAGDSPQVSKLAPLISGDFTGTTREILRWAACKWGISQNVVFAQAAVESWWRQGQLGDWGTDPRRCPPGHGIGADGRPGQCPQSYGILQNKYSFERAAWPGTAASTAMNADAAYAIWRSCYDGYEVWLNDEPRGQRYHAGNLWGCVGRWFAGTWFTPAADGYIRQVKTFFRARIWTRSSFARTG
jgi:autotransporter family porin